MKEARGAIESIPTGLWSRASATGRIALRLGAGGAKRLLRREEAMAELGEGLLRELDGLKGMAMKIGQILSYMEVGFSPEVTAKLAQLQEGVTPMPWAQIEAVIEGSLGAPTAARFEAIDPTPIAAASIGQVHRGRTLEGREVAVKVRYPGVERTMAADFKTMHRLAGLAGVFTAVDGHALVEELRARILEECDYGLEADTQRRFAGWLEGVEGLRVPEVLEELSTEAVLTTEFMEGVRFAEFAAGASPDAKRRAAGALFQLNFRPLLREGQLHADPHPGNQLYRLDGEVIALDFGCARRFEPEFMEVFLRLSDLLVAGDYGEGFRRAVIDLGLAPNPRKIKLEPMWEMLRWMYAPIWRERFRFTREWWEEGMRFTRPTAPNARHQGIPPEWLWLQRTIWGLWAVLLKLDAGELRFREAWRALRDAALAP